MYVVVQDPSLVICACHECLSLLLRADIESPGVDALEAAFDHCIFLLLCLKNTLVQIEVATECLCHNRSERTADELQRVLELNAIVLNLHFLVLGGWNDFEIPRHCQDEFHDEHEVVVRSIVEVDWQTIVLLVER